MSEENKNNYYMCSQWSKRLPANEILLHYGKITSEWSDKNRTNLSPKLISYDKNNDEKTINKNSEQLFEWYEPQQQQELSKKALIFIHGGYWQEGKVESSSFMAHVATSLEWNCHFIALGYDLAPKVTLYEIINQITLGLQAILELASEKGIDEVHIIGHSAGAYLAITPLFKLNHLQTYQRKIIKSCILLSGVYDLTPLLTTTINDAIGLTQDDLPLLNIANYYHEIKETMEKNDIKILIVVGEDESPGFYQQAENLYEKLKDDNVIVEYAIVAGKDHFNLVEDLTDEKDVLTEKIKNWIS